MATKRLKSTTPIARFSTGLGTARKEAIKVLRTARKRVDSLLPVAPRKQLQQLESRVQRVQKDIEKARKRVVRQAETRARRVLDRVGHQAASAARPFVDSLNLASRSEVDRLRKRIHDLEQRVQKTVMSRAEDAA